MCHHPDDASQPASSSSGASMARLASTLALKVASEDSRADGLVIGGGELNLDLVVLLVNAMEGSLWLDTKAG